MRPWSSILVVRESECQVTLKRIKLLLLALPFLLPPGVWATPASEEAEIGNSLARQGCYDTAVMFYEKALRLNPGYGPAISGRNAALRHLLHPNAKEKPPKPKKKEEKRPKKTETPVAHKAPPEKHPVVASVAKPHVSAPPAQIAKPHAVAVAPPPKPPTVKAATVAPPVHSTLTKPHVSAVVPAKPEQRPVAETAPMKPAVKPAVAVAVTHPSVPATSEVRTHPSNASHMAVPSDIGSAPPVSTSEAGAPAPEDKVPGWLIGMALSTFLLLVVLAVWWLSPTLSASRQLHDRLKGLERTRDER